MRRFDHLTIAVRDLDTARRFFGLLGFKEAISVVITGEQLKMGPLASTRMACMDEATSKQEDNYFKALDAATRYSYQDPYLLIYAQGFDKPLRFTRAVGNQP